jgi:hypothetical protein
VRTEGRLGRPTLNATKSESLLGIAFCRTLIKLSNAAFNHQSMSFKDDSGQDSLFKADSGEIQSNVFLEDVRYVLDSALDNPKGEGQVVHADACMVGVLSPQVYDLVITSPPYPNRMSYIRELRPYMYWLGFLTDPREAGEIDWSCIGGTWGVATSRLKDWAPKVGAFRPPYFTTILERIAHDGNANGILLSNYVAKYFEDIFQHLSSLRKVLAPGAQVHYIIGNSTFYGVLLPVERLYADIFRELGFSAIDIRPIRKRNSKKELVEFDVSAHWC